MTKTPVAIKDEDQVPSATVIDELATLVQEDAGKGISESREDKFYPLMAVLQPLSPQCDEASAAYIHGAKAGSIWLRNFDVPIVGGQEGIVVQPVLMYTEWVTWNPRERGGGMVGRSLIQPKGGRLIDAATNKWMLGENDLRETRMWLVNLIHENHGIPFVIPCQGTLNTFARQWMTVIDQQFESFGTKSPAWRHLWKLTTRQRTNAKGKWYVYSPEHFAIVTDKAMYMAGRNLYQSAKDALDKGLQLSEAAEREPGEDDDGAM